MAVWTGRERRDNREGSASSPEGGATRLPRLPRKAEALAVRQTAQLQGGLRYCLQPASMLAGHSLQVLIGGEAAYGGMLEAIASAQREIDLETYIWESDATGRRFADALAERARAGVVVRTLLDSAGSFGVDQAHIDSMRAAGVAVVLFHPVRPWLWRWGWAVRDHRKLLVVDGRVAFTGGFNIGDQYAPVSWGGRAWHDVHARVEGPAVGGLQRLFHDAWRYADESASGPYLAADERHAGTARAQPLAIGRRRDRRFIQRHYQFAVSRAWRTVWIENAYFIPNRRWRRVLSRAARRGVDVRVLVPRANDVPGIRHAARYTYAALLKSGVRIFEYLPTMLHAKTLVVDGEWCAVGSYNLDQRSLMYNWEVALAAVDEAACGQLSAQFLRDQEASAEIDPAKWARRGLWQKLRERFFYFFRLWL